ncbi:MULTISPECIES: glycosyltransferase family 4 protein [Thermodesulfovibrio]|jgi:UDP-N-acetylmuramyl pentapeptide phosphotransferase/UDP-N-acetylglucosamine-1-phosphate transferase|uniref:glycosyltransferase family 4 protein n=1 Tax=Thermodesulfovibrio TaxID=28261 RepID=UPI002603B7F0|nr:glycosyltransferase [Thermodesulfovibrio sp.]
MLSVLISFLLSFLVCLLIVRYSHIHGHLTSDPVEGGPQKFHKNPTPRIGGLSILFGLIGASLIFYLQNRDFVSNFTLALMCSTPLFAGGITEDLTKKISPKARLATAIVSGVLAFLLIDAKIERVDIPYLDDLLKLIPLSFIFSVFAIVGLSNAINIIDGFNGLASGVSIIILTGLAYVAFKVNDIFILFSCFVIIAAIFGFFIWNYPRGCIFLGDCGAYLLGFLIAIMSILLVRRNSQVSAWLPMLLLIYPVWETIFSIYRRRIKKGVSPSSPDRLHFHSLVYKRIVTWALGTKDARYLTRRNSATSVYLWGLTLLSFIPAVLFWNSSLLLQICTFSWILIYLWIYRKIVRFKLRRFSQ